MRIGTKSILFGYHQFALHPLLVFISWWKLFGFPWDPRLWAAFVFHDLGYWGKPNMDGPEGETHPHFGAGVMYVLFGPGWYAFCLYHSRALAAAHGQPVSRLAYADKMAILVCPVWLQLMLMNATGEIREYMSGAPGQRQVHYTDGRGLTQRQWVLAMQASVRRWFEEQHGSQELQTQVR